MSSVLLRRSSLALLLLALPASGCDCLFGLLGAVPFETESDGVVVFPLGSVGDCTSADDGTVPSNGEPDEDGNLTTYSHSNDGTVCQLKADWVGTLVNMEDVRAEVDAEIEEAGLDPANVRLNIISMTPTVETVVLRDDETDEVLDLGTDALLAYRGSISVEGDEDIIVASYDGNGDPTVPDVDVKDSATLVALANTSFAEGTPLSASGTGNSSIAMAELPTIQAAGQPALVVTFKIVVAGEASLGSGE
jgi:hypothetical protein